MHGSTGERFTKVVAACDNKKMKIYILLNLTSWRCFSVQCGSKPPQEKYICCKNSLWFTELRIRVYTFRNVYEDAADHMTKSDLDNEFKMAVTIMMWFLQGIPLSIWQSRHQWNILNMLIKTWIANLSIGDEDNCCQCRNFDGSALIWPCFLLCSPPVISNIIGSDPRCAANVKAARGSDLNQTMRKDDDSNV